MKPLFTLIIVFSTSVFLTACSGGPSDAEVKAMFEKETEEVSSLADSYIGDESPYSDMTKQLTNSFMPQVQDVKGTDCQKAKNETYDCTATFEYKQMGTEINTTNSFSVKKVDGDWKFVN